MAVLNVKYVMTSKGTMTTSVLASIFLRYVTSNAATDAPLK